MASRAIGRNAGARPGSRGVEPGDDADGVWMRLAEIADMYWVQGMKIEEIGRRLSLSRSTVSRELARARATGVIEFRVHWSNTPAEVLRRMLQERFEVSIEVTTPTDEGRPARFQSVGRAASSWLTSLVGPGDVVAVSWGSTVDALSTELRPRPSSGVELVQLHGWGTGPAQGPNYASSILDRFGAAFHARVHYLPLPAFFDSPATRRAVWEEPWLKNITELRARANLLVTSVGVPDEQVHGHVYDLSHLALADRQELVENGVVGNLGAIFFRDDATASTEGITINDRSTGMAFEEVRQIPIRLLVAADPQKARAVRTLLAAHVVTHAVLDQITAQAVYELAPTPDARRVGRCSDAEEKPPNAGRCLLRHLYP